jgi:hypothetical protein
MDSTAWIAYHGGHALSADGLLWLTSGQQSHDTAVTIDKGTESKHNEDSNNE